MRTAHATPAVELSFVRSLPRTLPGKFALTLTATIFIALCAHVSVPLPFTPVPLTLGNFAVVLVGFALGPVIAFAALALYLAEGAMGFPVFNPGGLGGIAQLLGPTGGFLFAYPLAAVIAGTLIKLFSRFTVRGVAAAASYCVATMLILSSGAGWLALQLHLSVSAAFHLGVFPFLPGEVVKMIAAAGIYTTLARRHPTHS